MGIKNILGINKVVDIVDKVVVDKDKKEEIMAELDKMNMEADIKLQELLNARMGTKLEKCISTLFPAVGFVFVLYLLSNLIMYWICFFRGTEPKYIEVAKELFQVMMIYLSGFFAKRTIDGYTKR